MHIVCNICSGPILNQGYWVEIKEKSGKNGLCLKNIREKCVNLANARDSQENIRGIACLCLFNQLIS